MSRKFSKRMYVRITLPETENISIINRIKVEDHQNILCESPIAIDTCASAREFPRIVLTHAHEFARCYFVFMRTKDTL